jgi:hypothetical protein
MKFEEFRVNCRIYLYNEKNDGSEYKQHLLSKLLMHLIDTLVHHSPISHINLHDKYIFPNLNDVFLHGKLCDLQEHGFGEKLDSIAINSQQIKQILQHPRLSASNPESLLYCIFFVYQ